MAQSGSAETAARPSPSSGLAWAVIVAATVAAWAWVKLAEKLGAAISIESEVTANALFYLILFAPLAAIGIGAGVLLRIRTLRVGDAPGRWIGMGAALGLGGLLASLALSWIQGGVVTGAGSGVSAGVILLGIILTLFQTGAEEVFFRGWLQPALVERVGPVAGIAAGALCFAAFHVAGGARAPVSLVSITLAGVLFGLLAWRSGGVLAGIAAHFVWNVVESSVLGLVPNPGVDVFGTVVDLDLMGASLWGGHEEGLNASIGTVAVLVALIVPLAWRPQPVPVLEQARA
jgi:membrane protease YdiL (CAAX protease family)